MLRTSGLPARNPGNQDRKRHRRSNREIERKFKCGWQGCDKAYGELRNLNTHITKQSHGEKRVVSPLNTQASAKKQASSTPSTSSKINAVS